MSHQKVTIYIFIFSNSPTNSPARLQWQQTEVSLPWAMVTLAAQKCQVFVFLVCFFFDVVSGESVGLFVMCFFVEWRLEVYFFEFHP